MEGSKRVLLLVGLTLCLVAAVVNSYSPEPGATEAELLTEYGKLADKVQRLGYQIDVQQKEYDVKEHRARQNWEAIEAMFEELKSYLPWGH